MFSAYHTLRYRDPVMVTVVDKGIHVLSALSLIKGVSVVL